MSHTIFSYIKKNIKDLLLRTLGVLSFLVALGFIRRAFVWYTTGDYWIDIQVSLGATDRGWHFFLVLCITIIFYCAIGLGFILRKRWLIDLLYAFWLFKTLMLGSTLFIWSFKEVGGMTPLPYVIYAYILTSAITFILIFSLKHYFKL